VSEITWSPRAVADLEEIRAFIALDSADWAELTSRRIIASIERLREFPESGRIVPERQSATLREVISGNFRIVYRLSGTTVEIVAVFRASRNFRSTRL
jgi:toxin ParE1/3/4